MTDEERADRDPKATPGEPWLITRPPPPPPPLGSAPPDAGPPSSGPAGPDTVRLPPVSAASSPAPDTGATAATTPGPPAAPPPPSAPPPPAAPPPLAASAPAPADEPRGGADPSGPPEPAPPVLPVLPAPPAPPTAADATAPFATVESPPADEPAAPAAAEAKTEPEAEAEATVPLTAAMATATPSSPTEPSGPEPAPTPAAKETPAKDGTRSSSRSFSAAGTSAVKAATAELQSHSPWVLGSAATLLAFAVGWFAGILLSFRHLGGYTARDRILQFFAPGTLAWALAILLAVALFAFGRRLEAAQDRRSHLTDLLPGGLFLAGVAVMVSALIGVLVELTNFGNGIDAAFASLIQYLAIFAIGAADTWWAHLELRARREAKKPTP